MRSLKDSSALQGLRVQMAKRLREAADRLAPPDPGKAVAATIDAIFGDVAAYLIQEKSRLLGRIAEHRAATRKVEHELAAAREWEARALDAERAGEQALAGEARALARAHQTTAEREGQRAEILGAQIEHERNELIRTARAVDRMQLARKAVTADWTRLDHGRRYSIPVLEALAEIWEGLVTDVDAPIHHTPEDSRS
ncbi:MAG: hypothetical protein QM820_23745 [Minicystis sp.]